MKSLVVLALCVGVCLAQSSRGNRKEGTGPCERPNGFFPHESHCDKYYDCVDNIHRVVDCPNGLAFTGGRRGLIQRCDYPHRINCGSRRLFNDPLGSKPCNFLYGIFEHETSCTKYYTCWNGTATPQTCHKGLLWNQKDFGCDWPQNVDGCQTHPLCEDSFDQITDYPGTGIECFKFVQCIGGTPTVQKCPAGLAYSKETKTCRPYYEVAECAEFFTTTPAPESEEDDEYEDERPRPRFRQPAQGGPPRRANRRF